MFLEELSRAPGRGSGRKGTDRDIVHVLGVAQCPSGEVLSSGFSMLTNLFSQNAFSAMCELSKSSGFNLIYPAFPGTPKLE